MAVVLSFSMQTPKRREPIVAAMVGVCLCLLICARQAGDGVAPIEAGPRPSPLRNSAAVAAPPKSPEHAGSTVEYAIANEALASVAPDTSVDPAREARSVGRAANRAVVTLAAETRSIDDSNHLLLVENLSLLKRGQESFRRLPAYVATFYKRERVGASLTNGESIRIKVRHEPFSVYMKWLSGDTGKEVLYVDGTNNGRMLVRLGGVKGRLLPAMSIDPFGVIALTESRYPVDKVGILALTETLIEHRERELRDGVAVRCRYAGDFAVDGRPCRAYHLDFADPGQSPVYRKSIQYVDREWNVPIHIENYTWTEMGQSLEGAALDETTLIEYYSYSEIGAAVELTDGDFDRSNSEYRFRR